MTAHLHPATGLPYFGYDSDWNKVLPAEKMPSPRSTTSSRHPGRELTGTIWADIRKADVCLACGRVTGGFPGAHAPHAAMREGQDGLIVDCIGRPCARDVSGYYQVVGVTP